MRRLISVVSRDMSGSRWGRPPVGTTPAHPGQQFRSHAQGPLIIADRLLHGPAMNDAYPTDAPRIDNARVIHPPRGTDLACRNWLIEAAYRMIQHNLDPEVAENPAELVVY